MLLDSETIAQAREEERSVREAYDRVPYLSASQHRTHPDHLAALAILHGLEPAPPDRCRVLELGCADGGNLVPMAIELPGSRFLGIDLSPRQIDTGRAFAAEMGLENLELQTRSILDVDAALGEFDYILCHGVFSWVSRPVQEKILAVCRGNLAPHGIAYVSYNTYPGWRLRGMVRDMLLFHTRGVDAPEERTGRAFELMRFLAGAVGQEQDAHAIFLRTTRDHFEEHRDRPSYLLHEYLAETNDPLYFHEMVERAGRHGLQYLTESDPHPTGGTDLPAFVAEELERMSTDRIVREQYLDFVVNRTFRRTLFCRAGLDLERTSSPERLRRLHASSAVKPASPVPDLRPGLSETFRNEKGETFSSDHPLAKVALVSLAAAWPGTVAFQDLLDAVRREMAADETMLADLLDALFRSGVVELHAHPPVCAGTVGELPCAARLARHQAGSGLLVTNQRRRNLKLDDPMALFLLLHLDGTRDREALVDLLETEVAEGRLKLEVDGKPVEPGPRRKVLETLLDHHLRKMAEHALLVG
jgi:methyltransferase-like protein/cyclopropane fatty-acyl-phospholipid synthase-like methyltransferase